ncbi:zinc ribbon domain-containing protein [Halorussus halobius]|uniref:zinc ribbon domain-containing protein n=1 Tax=Halorussus halobius TaxID=1710537 RepID=UPI00109235CB|nr:zinc ribbon domain-containing protein [Halorussus halobius]
MTESVPSLLAEGASENAPLARVLRHVQDKPVEPRPEDFYAALKLDDHLVVRLREDMPGEREIPIDTRWRNGAVEFTTKFRDVGLTGRRQFLDDVWDADEIRVILYEHSQFDDEYHCPTCGALSRDPDSRVLEGANEVRVRCPECGVVDYIPQGSEPQREPRHDDEVLTDGGTSPSGTSRTRGTRRELPTDVPVFVHRVGGRDSDGSQATISRWTFEAEQVRSVAEEHLQGRVLNATAGKTRLSHDGDVVRNDINPEMPADTHVDVQAADEHWPSESFDSVVLDPPFDAGQAEARYGGWHASDFSVARDALEPLVRPGGIAISLGWTTYAFAEQFAPDWGREELHIYQRGPVHPDVFLMVDRKTQTTLAMDGGKYDTETDRDEEVGD